MRLRVGVIGERKHAARMIDRLRRCGRVSIDHVYLPHRLPALPGATQRFEDILNTDAVFVLSPSDSHYEYLLRLDREFPGYVFCEKLPVTTLAQLDALELDPSRVHFNFNYRFCAFRRAYDEALESGALGCPLQFHAVSTNGLAFKDEYVGSWRAGGSRHAVTETKAVHMIDLATVLFGEVDEVHYWPSNMAGRGEAHDTSHTVMAMRDGVVASVTASYAAPLSMTVRVIGTNGMLEYGDNRLVLRSPRNTFDRDGLFAPPPETVLEDFAGREIGFHLDSLDRSLAFFLDRVERGEPLPAELYHHSLQTNRFILGLEGDAAA